MTDGGDSPDACAPQVLADEIVDGEAAEPDEVIARPLTRGDCAGGVRPCPWVSCRHHLLELRLGRGGDIPETNNAVVERLAMMGNTCALDVADRGESTLDEVGTLLGVTRERIRQIETGAKRTMARRSAALHVLADVPEPPPSRAPLPRVQPTAVAPTAPAAAPPAPAAAPRVSRAPKPPRAPRVGRHLARPDQIFWRGRWRPMDRPLAVTPRQVPRGVKPR